MTTTIPLIVSIQYAEERKDRDRQTDWRKNCNNICDSPQYSITTRPLSAQWQSMRMLFVWHPSITAEQRDQLEAIQRRAVRIIFGKEIDFDILPIIHDIPLLTDRCDRQMRQLFTGMHDSSHFLHRLLQENSVESAIHTLSNCKNYRVPFARTNRFKNLLYVLRNFQWVLLNSLSVIYIAYWHFIEHTPTCMLLSFHPAVRLQHK